MAQDETTLAVAAMASAPNQHTNKDKPQDGKDADKEESEAPAKQEKELYPMSNWKYDTFLWTMSVLVDLFFREVHPRGSWKVPRQGPVLFVAAPHANQFVDALILQDRKSVV